jgi:hypothetical protein
MAAPSIVRRLAAALAALLASACVSPARAEEARPTEYQVKAAYLSKFGKFVEYPPSVRPLPDDKFYVCIIGRDPFGAVLDTAVQGETVGRAAVAARRITRIEDAPGCRVLFISASEDAKLKAILAGLRQAPLLTVSDLPDFTRRGGMIRFVIEGNRVRFDVNLTAARAAGLNLSSDLLQLAVAIRRAP